MFTSFLLMLIGSTIASSSPWGNINFEEENSNGEIIATWAETAFDWLQKLKCANQIHFSEETCSIIQKTDKSNFRIYGVEPVAGNKYGAVFPEGESKHKLFHDGVLVLDPLPTVRFGHPIAVFYVDGHVTSSKCELQKGFFMEPDTCIQPVSRSYVNIYLCNLRPKLKSLSCPSCGEMVFLPLVHLQTDFPLQINDQLQCYANIKGFDQSCPRLRSKQETISMCDRTVTNSNCGFFENTLKSRCSMSQTCDYAVLLSGGWNRQFSDQSTFENVMGMKKLLTLHGYPENNIETFYANGPTKQLQDYSEKEPEYHPASRKSTIRNHIKTICDSELCADSLFIYMNSPSRPDGASLLWDTYNGKYHDTDMYKPRELMKDIAYCKANRVIIVADQSYGAALVATAEARFSSLENVVLFTPTDEFNSNAIKDSLTHYILKSQYEDICLNDLKNTLYLIRESSVFVGSKPNLLNSTLVGGPCSKSVSVNNPETSKYRGCSLTTAV